MEVILNFLRSDLFLMIIAGLTILLFILYIINLCKQRKIQKEYLKFVRKIGNGNNIDEMLREYISKVEEVKNKNQELMAYCHELDENMASCIQKVGIIRYSAFKDTGSDLSFALALLDENNDGIVLNGIYSREMSNIYAKPVAKGKSTYTISEEEQQAIDIAKKAEKTYRIRE